MIISFPIKPRVIITRALITSETEGARTIRHDPPQSRFFLEFEDGDGSYIVWDGLTHVEALEAAQDWLADGVEVRDRVADTRGRT